MRGTASLFSSYKQDWRTPDYIYQSLHDEFHFDFDPCPPKVPTWKTHGLAIEWGNVNFVNPPYSDIKRWVAKAFMEWQKGKTVVLLIPSRTDTKWWHEYVMKATEIRFIKGRLRFGGSRYNAPFPSCIVVFQGWLVKSHHV